MRRIFMTADWFLGSLGIAMLSLSLMLVPTGGLLADTGTNVPVPNDCLAANGCNNGCAQSSTGACSPSSGTTGCTNGCSNCFCGACIYRQQGWACNCQCQSGSGTCSDTITCVPN
jgi:hypothetical protein